MPKKQPENFEYLSNDPNFVPDPDIVDFMEEEIARAPKDPEQLAELIRQETAASPKDSGGDYDADWQDVNNSGVETIGGDHPTPDMSVVEENAESVGVTFQDNEELRFLEKIVKRDEERFELDERSKANDESI